MLTNRDTNVKDKYLFLMIGAFEVFETVNA